MYRASCRDDLTKSEDALIIDSINRFVKPWKKTRVVLHIGANKTGSTAIQDTCSASRKRLEEAGIFYPKVGSQSSHSMLLPAVLDDEEYRGNFNRRDADGRKKSIQKSIEFWNVLSAQVQQSKCDTLLLSSEFILGMRPQSFERLLERIKTFSDDIQAIAYIRDPCDHYLSSAQQVLKYGTAVKDPREKQKFAEKLSKCDRFLPDKVIKKEFSRSKLFSGDVTLDLLSEILGKSRATALSISTIRTNATISAEGMALLSEFNSSIWGERRIVGNKLNKQLLVALAEQETKGNYTKPVLRPKIHELVSRLNVGDMHRLKDEYGLNFDKFAYDLPPITELSEADQTWLQKLEVSDIVSYDPVLADTLKHQVMAWALRKAHAQIS